MNKTTSKTKPELTTLEKAQLFSAWANLQVTRISLIETGYRNRALGSGRHFDKEINQTDEYLAWVEAQLRE